jgi:hypothetical protein
LRTVTRWLCGGGDPAEEAIGLDDRPPSRRAAPDVRLRGELPGCGVVHRRGGTGELVGAPRQRTGFPRQRVTAPLPKKTQAGPRHRRSCRRLSCAPQTAHGRPSSGCVGAAGGSLAGRMHEPQRSPPKRAGCQEHDRCAAGQAARDDFAIGRLASRGRDHSRDDMHSPRLCSHRWLESHPVAWCEATRQGVA